MPSLQIQNRFAKRIISFSAIFTITGAVASAQMFPGANVSTGSPSSPRGLAAMDINNDGKVDFVTASSASNSISVLLGNHSVSGFAAPVQYSAGTGPEDVALGDLNMDGLIDAATANLGNNTLSVLLATAPGVFGAPLSLAIGSGPNTINIADVNNDGKLDLLANASNVFTASVFLGNGAGGFAAPITFVVGIRCERPRLGDLDNDGKLDFVARDSNTTIARALGLGNGSFGTLASTTTSGAASDLAVIDMTNDGNRDVVGCSQGFNPVLAGKIFIFPGDGAGGFGSSVTSDWLQAATRLAVFDLNADGKMDVMTSNGTNGQVTINKVAIGLGNALGGFASGSSFPVPGGPVGIVGIDYSGDGFVDIACAVSTSNSISISPGNGTGTFTSANLYAIAGLPLAGAIGDFNKDGRPDLVYSSYTAPTLGLNLGDGNGNFTSSPIPTNPYVLTGITFADMNGDFNLDVVTAGTDTSTSTGRASVLLGNGAGAFASPLTVTAGNTLFAVSIYDLNLDGKLDAIVANNPSPGAGSIVTLLGNGSGGFGAPANFPLPASPRMITVGDMNQDGLADLAVPISQASSMSLLLGNGAGGFTPAPGLTAGSVIQTAIIADINLDAVTDILTTNSAGYTVFQGNGSGGFVTMNQPMPVVLSSARLGDVNNDGYADIVANTSTAIVSVLLGSGTINFGSPFGFMGSSLVDLSDMNADGREDAVTFVGLFGSGITAVLLNQTPMPLALTHYGTGTFGCAGTLGLSGITTPSIGSNFGYICTNAPRRALGVLLATDSQDFAGSDPFGINATIHVDFTFANEIFAYDILSHAAGTAGTPAPIPNNSMLIGKQFFAQAVWIEDAASGQHCSAASYGVVTSRAMVVTIHP